MKPYTYIILLFLTVATLFSACGEPAPAEPTAAPVVFAEIPAEVPTEIPTEAPTEAPTEPVPPETELPYLQKIPRPDQSIFDGPGYDYIFSGTVKEAGTYTIVEEVWDNEGNLWGRLKSGAGWVDLSEILQFIENPAPISANFAEDRLLSSGNYHHYLSDTSEYAVKITFYAYETLKNVTFFSMELTETMEKDEDLYSIPELTPEMPFVAAAAFPGDMTTYGISFTDQNGTAHCYTVSISGRNGTLVLSEYIP
jgi:hypothetical protein